MSFPVLDMIDLCSDDELRELGVIGGSSEKPKDQGGSLDDSSHPVGPSSLPPPPISRQFWKAGDYEVAIAELVDNAIDEEVLDSLDFGSDFESFGPHFVDIDSIDNTVMD
ncbi:hypothetical protein GH714_010247 [Hevea brasiliensis]|uniref:Uncharacterized protein n=1 Tax=Hevea brasiliensis TaxID=3981 RepID=A0A6A6M7I6_HEVBR|nr:hypothetical protein GH714_010247 [Hevea brasiliensis]